MTTSASSLPAVSVSSQGMIRALSLKSTQKGKEQTLRDSEAVVLVSTPGDTYISNPRGQLTKQTEVVRIEVRQVRQLGIQRGVPLNGPLCVGDNFTAEVVLKDYFGRAFDRSADGRVCIFSAACAKIPKTFYLSYSLEGWATKRGGNILKVSRIYCLW